MKHFEDGHRIKHYLQPNELNQTEQLPPKPSSRNKYSTVTKNKTQQHAIEDIKEIYRKYKKIQEGDDANSLPTIKYSQKTTTTTILPPLNKKKPSKVPQHNPDYDFMMLSMIGS